MADRLTAEQEAALHACDKLATPDPVVAWSTEGQTASGHYRYSICHEPNSDELHFCVAEAFGRTEEEARANAHLLASARVLLTELTAVRAEHKLLRDAVLKIREAADRPGTYNEQVERVMRAANGALDVACGVGTRGDIPT